MLYSLFGFMTHICCTITSCVCCILPAIICSSYSSSVILESENLVCCFVLL